MALAYATLDLINLVCLAENIEEYGACSIQVCFEQQPARRKYLKL